MLRPPGEIMKMVLPDRAAPDTPVTPVGDPPTTVIWPPVRKLCLPANVRVTESLAPLYATLKAVIGCRTRLVWCLTRLVVTVLT